MSGTVDNACTCISALATDPSCSQHGTTVRTRPDLYIDGRPYEGELLFPELAARRPERPTAADPDLERVTEPGRLPRKGWLP